MLKKNVCLIALLVGNPLSLAGQGAETTPKLPKKESWPLVKKVKQTFVNHPVVATLGVAAAITATAYLAITYTSTGSKIPKPQTPVNEEIRVKVHFEDSIYILSNIRASSTSMEGFLYKFINDKLDPSYKNPAYLYSAFYNKKKINLNDYKKKLDALGIENNAVLEISVDKQPVSLTIQYGNGEPKEKLTIQADKRNSLDWLKRELSNKVNIPIEDQELYLGEKLLSGESFKEILNSSNPEEQIVELREMKKITLTVELEGNTYTLKRIATNKKLNRVIALATKKLGTLQKRAYQYSINYNGTKITGNYRKITLAQSGIEENAQIKLIADNQPITLILQYGADEPKKELTIQADKRNTFGWLKAQISKRLGIDFKYQSLRFKTENNSSTYIKPKDSAKFSSYKVFSSSNKGIIELE